MGRAARETQYLNHLLLTLETDFRVAKGKLSDAQRSRDPFQLGWPRSLARRGRIWAWSMGRVDKLLG